MDGYRHHIYPVLGYGYGSNTKCPDSNTDRILTLLNGSKLKYGRIISVPFTTLATRLQHAKS